MATHPLIIIDVICSHCGTANEASCKFQYGRCRPGQDNFYRIGDRVDMLALNHSERYVRDKRLKYVHVFPNTEKCSRCGSALAMPYIATLENDRIETVHSQPVVAPDLDLAQRRLWQEYTATEIVLLYRQFGAERVVRLFAELFLDEKGEIKPEHADKNVGYRGEHIPGGKEGAERFREIALGLRTGNVLHSVPDIPRPRLVREAVHGFRSRAWSSRVVKHLKELHGRDVVNVSENRLATRQNCPSCGHLMDATLEFRYGPSNGHKYEIGDSVDWSALGPITDIQDSRLKYVGLIFPPCAKCSFEPLGYATLAQDRIESLLLLSREAMSLMNEPSMEGVLRQGWGNDYDPLPLTLFVLLRDHGATLFAESLAEFKKKYLTITLNLGWLSEYMTKRQAEALGRQET